MVRVVVCEAPLLARVASPWSAAYPCRTCPTAQTSLAEFEVAEGGVYAVTLSPNGDRVAAAGGDGTVRLYDVKKSALASSFVLHS